MTADKREDPVEPESDDGERTIVGNPHDIVQSGASELDDRATEPDLEVEDTPGPTPSTAEAEARPIASDEADEGGTGTLSGAAAALAPEAHADDDDTTPREATEEDGPTEPQDSRPPTAQEGEPEVEEEPTPPIHVAYYGRTDVGLVREHNEDNFLLADVSGERRDCEEGQVQETNVGRKGGIFAVCDGMGGAAAGEVASQLAADTLWEYFAHFAQPADRDHFARRITTAIEDAGNRIFAAAKADRSRRGMGTTATVAGLIDQVLFVGQVGDSRAYILRGGELRQITKDQSLVNQLVEAGQLTEEEAEAFEHSNIILQALGTTEEVTVDLTFLELRRGDRLMLCSDGLSGLVHPETIKDTLEETRDLVECTQRLIDMANAAGGHDNVTVVCADFDGPGLVEATDSEPPTYQQYPLPPLEEVPRESLPLRLPEGFILPQEEDSSPTLRADETPTAGSRVVPVEGGNSRWRLLVLIMILAAVATAVVILATSGQDARTRRGPGDRLEQVDQERERFRDDSRAVTEAAPE